MASTHLSRRRPAGCLPFFHSICSDAAGGCRARKRGFQKICTKSPRECCVVVWPGSGGSGGTYGKDNKIIYLSDDDDDNDELMMMHAQQFYFH